MKFVGNSKKLFLTPHRWYILSSFFLLCFPCYLSIYLKFNYYFPSILCFSHSCADQKKSQSRQYSCSFLFLIVCVPIYIASLHCFSNCICFRMFVVVLFGRRKTWTCVVCACLIVIHKFYSRINHINIIILI